MKNQAKKFNGTTLVNPKTFITRRTRKGDLDSNGVQIQSTRCFCLKKKGVEDKDLKAYPFLYDYDAIDENGKFILVAYKPTKTKVDKKTNKKYKQTTFLIEHKKRGQETQCLVGYLRK